MNAIHNAIFLLATASTALFYSAATPTHALAQVGVSYFVDNCTLDLCLNPIQVAQAQGTAHLLNGKVFAVRSGLQGEAADSDDEFIFKDGRFRSVSCDQWGFSEGVVSTAVDGGMIRFQTETTSQKHGNMVWQGVVQGDKIEGTYTWTKEGLFGTKRQDKWFTGMLKK